ncbi:hypothetical protein BVY04_03620 [bacterium M21]|nr:hypothetical protein BVY04_03620 [bacterium M21]
MNGTGLQAEKEYTMNAGYSATVEGFLNQDANAIVAILCDKSQSIISREEPARFTSQWQGKIKLLQETLGQLRGCSGWDRWHVYLEYPIPWTVKHIDVVLLARDLVFAMEIRTDAEEYDQDDIWLVEDFCLQLRDYHPMCDHRTLVPVLVATKAPSTATHHTKRQDFVQQVFLSNEERLLQLLGYVVESYTDLSPDVDAEAWEKADLRATPSLIEATQALFAGEHVNEALLLHGDADGLPAEKFVVDLIKQAKANKEKIVCFMHGVPGSGKTLTGLSVARKTDGLFLSGNAPFVSVLQRAILENHHDQEIPNMVEKRQETKEFIRELYDFFDKHYGGDIEPPSNVVILDDAHRARDRHHFPKKYIRQRTEAGMLLDIMNRPTDWAVIVALVGDGSLINTVEAGLPAWRESLIEDFPAWKIVAPLRLFGRGEAELDEQLFDQIPDQLVVEQDEVLQLNSNLRPHRTRYLSEFVNAILDHQPEAAKQILQDHMGYYPVFYTRDLDAARTWLRETRRGNRKIGLIASTGAKRLKAHDLNVPERLPIEHWYLGPPEDVRSASHLETASRERFMQGLELDWSCVCWGADLRHDSAVWQYNRFHGSAWMLEEDEEAQDVIRNRYRVLLTRARQGMVIWLPEGKQDDPTRQPDFYDHTVAYLEACGIPQLGVVSSES